NALTEEEEQAEYEAYKKRLMETSSQLPQLDTPEVGEQIAVITTNFGVMQAKLCREQTPTAVENFVSLAQSGYYDGLIFHRVIDDFMIQGGDPLGTGQGGESAWGGKFNDEFSPEMYHFKGAIAMANSGPDTNGSQFYIVQRPAIVEGYFAHVDEVIAQYGSEDLLYSSSANKIFRTNYSEEARAAYEKLGGTPDLDYGYTVFGQVFSGIEVVDAIAKVQANESDKPLEDVVIESIKIVEYEG
ncbi:MAG: peptidylprolyl isomerase, partial [Anaerotignaceae bacterium]